VLLSFQATGKPVRLDRIAIVINDDVVMQSEVQTRIDAVLANIKRRNAQAPPSDKLREQVVEQLILESIQMQIAERAGIRVDDNTLNSTMERIARKNGMALSEFQEALSKDGASYQEAREQVRREMITTRVREGSIGRRIQVTNQEIINYLESEMGKDRLQAEYHIGHILIKVPADSTDEEILVLENHAKQLSLQLNEGADFAEYAATYSNGPNADKGGDMGWRKENQLPSLFAEIAPDLFKGDVSAPIKSSNGFHIIKMLDRRGGENIMMAQTRVRHILIKPSAIRDEQQSQAFAAELRARILAGEDFASLAKTYSDDTGTLNSGGDLGWSNPNDLVPGFRNVMKTAAVNELSEPFRSRYGWHILEVLERRQQDLGDEIRRKKAQEAIYQRKYDEELQLWLREQRENAYVDIKVY
jgi:peptidyl-prolyl cis-trans isomerase SurA